VVLGFGKKMLEGFLLGRPSGMEEMAGHHPQWLLYVSVGLAAMGLAVTWVEFGRRKAGQIGFVERIPAIKSLFLERWYIDRMYRRLLDVVIYRGVSNIFTKNDNRVIDGSIDAMCEGTVRSGRILSDLHLSMIQYKLLVMFVAVFFLVLYFFLS
jgi:NADH-quinone oxidoreductase subunit L